MPDTSEIQKAIESWKFLLDPAGARFRRLEGVWRFYSKQLFTHYEPLASGHSEQSPIFDDRLLAWLGNCSSEDDQKALYELIDHLFFVGPREFESLYSTALHKAIVPWLAELAAIKIDANNYDTLVRREIGKTLISPITDSLRINSFYHVCKIGKRDLRPDLRTLIELGDDKKIERFLEEENISQIVLLEDFVGTGSQVKKFIVRAALRLKRPILFVPLLICPTGRIVFERLAEKHSMFYFSPVICLPDSVFVAETAVAGEPEYFSTLRTLALATKGNVIGPKPNARAKAMSPFGYAKTGGLVITHANAPNNTLLLLHRLSETWQPLFPRSKR
ncbi:hypothetical protein SB778_31120 [Paraburkholderia sp. SIMBA_050]